MRLRGTITALALLMSACGGAADTVKEIAIVNGTSYALDVEVSGAERGGWLPIAIISGDSSRTATGVIDQGEVWVFRFRHWGEPVGEVSLTRAELEADGWRVQVPEMIAERLEELGRSPFG